MSRPLHSQHEADEVTGFGRRSGDTLPSLQLEASRKGVMVLIKRQPGIALVVLSVLGIGGVAAKDNVPMPAMVTAEWVKEQEQNAAEVGRVSERVSAIERWACRFERRFLMQSRWEARKDQRRVEEIDSELDALGTCR